MCVRCSANKQDNVLTAVVDKCISIMCWSDWNVLEKLLKEHKLTQTLKRTHKRSATLPTVPSEVFLLPPCRGWRRAIGELNILWSSYSGSRDTWGGVWSSWGWRGPAWTVLAPLCPPTSPTLTRVSLTQVHTRIIYSLSSIEWRDGAGKFDSKTKILPHKWYRNSTLLWSSE